MVERFHNFERRSSHRVEAHLPVKISGTDFHFATDTKNISSAGLYCQVNRFIPVLTKLALILFIPLIVKNQKVEKQINCSAVIVRVEPETEQAETMNYNVGLFFTDIKDKDRAVIAKYIQQAFFAGSN